MKTGWLHILHNFGEMIGQFAPIKYVLQSVALQINLKILRKKSNFKVIIVRLHPNSLVHF